MSVGQHSHAGNPNLEEHLKNCSDGSHADYSESYVHKHLAECLEGDPNATMLEEEEGVNIVRFKIIIIIVFFVICMAGIIPKAWSGCAKREWALSLLNCFAAGMFLAMALMHLLPEGVELYDGWAAEHEIEEPFPLAYLMFFVGFLLVLCVDRVIARALTGGKHHGMEEQGPKTGRGEVELAEGTAGTENTTKPQEPQTIQPAVNEEEAPNSARNLNAKIQPGDEETVEVKGDEQ